MKRGIRRAGLAALVATTIGTSSHISSTYGEPANLPKTSPSLEERSYEDCKIAFASMSMKDR